MSDSFLNLMRALWRDDQYATATAIEDHLGLTDVQREILHPVIASHCRLCRRGDVREIEQEGDRIRLGVTTPAADPHGRPAFLAERFACPDGRYPRWDEATIEDHLARVGMLEKLRDTLLNTIDRHRWAVREILDHDVKCLGDLYPVVGQ